MARFAPQYTVVLLDLAGHGASGQEHIQWTVPAFGQDVVAVVEHLGLNQVVLMSGVGHFVMLEDPQTFNRLLDAAIRRCILANVLP